jgi:hypothetical protein
MVVHHNLMLIIALLILKRLIMWRFGSLTLAHQRIFLLLPLCLPFTCLPQAKARDQRASRL